MPYADFIDKANGSSGGFLFFGRLEI